MLDAAMPEMPEVTGGAVPGVPSFLKPLKTAAITVGSLFAIAHIGLLGYLIKDNSIPEFPVINFPKGDYCVPIE